MTMSKNRIAIKREKKRRWNAHRDLEASAGSVPLAEINRKTKESRFASSGASDAMIVFQYPFQGPAGSVPSGVCAYHCLSSGFDLRMERLPPSRPPSPRGPMPCGIEGIGRAHSRNGGGGRMRRIGCGAPKGAARGGGAFFEQTLSPPPAGTPKGYN